MEMMLQSIMIEASPAPGATLALSLDSIVYIIIVIFWVLANVSRQKKRRRDLEEMPNEPPPIPRGGRPMDDELREMIETLTGQKLDRPQAPTPPPLVEHPPGPRAPQPSPSQLSKHVRPDRDRRHVRRQPASPPPTPAAATAVRAAQAEQSARLEVLSNASAAAANVQTAMTMTIKTVANRMKPINLPSLRMGVSGGEHLGHARPLVSASDLKDPETLRRAVIFQTIVGPPKALEQPSSGP